MRMEATLHPVCKYQQQQRQQGTPSSYLHPFFSFPLNTISSPTRGQRKQAKSQTAESRPDDNPMAVAFCHLCAVRLSLTPPFPNFIRICYCSCICMKAVSLNCLHVAVAGPELSIASARTSCLLAAATLLSLPKVSSQDSFELQKLELRTNLPRCLCALILN
ncbi:hypothetical protein CCHR01_09281 [Colletotrichum chrysophilum]|uniref:Uncharacterized protein n=1 Tax=Colletotrichum chrysophilum TaxID=1836956 RepID=A0AAD9EKM3_9PEZI|nr:hypothetical protein CCHR01_09281 [Colletotrichum chrysophilum]